MQYESSVCFSSLGGKFIQIWLQLHRMPLISIFEINSVFSLFWLYGSIPHVNLSIWYCLNNTFQVYYAVPWMQQFNLEWTGKQTHTHTHQFCCYLSNSSSVNSHRMLCLIGRSVLQWWKKNQFTLFNIHFFCKTVCKVSFCQPKAGVTWLFLFFFF